MALHTREDHAFVRSFRIVAVDGVDVTTASLGPTFPHYLFVAQDGSNDSRNQNFKLAAARADPRRLERTLKTVSPT